MLLRPPGVIQNGIHETRWEFLTTAFGMGGPPPWDNQEIYGQGCGGRMDAMGKSQYKMHAELAPTDHWYVFWMAVSPEHQGTGCCGALLNLLNVASDQGGYYCFLDTIGERNAAVYAKYGYAERKDFIVRDSSTEAEPDLNHIALIRRPPKEASDRMEAARPISGREGCGRTC